MAHVYKTKLSLRISGDSLIPADVTKLLGAEPAFSHAKGDEYTTKSTGEIRQRRSGLWLIHVEERSPENLDAQLNELFGMLTDDLDAWKFIDDNYSADLFCGLFMQGFNEGLLITARMMKKIADRRLCIGFDIYGGDGDNT